MAYLIAVLIIALVERCTGADILVSASLNEDITLPCRHGIPSNLVHIAQWYKNPQEGALNDPVAQKFIDTLTVSHKFNLTKDFDLRISNVGVEDEGRYKCFISPTDLRPDFIGFAQLKPLAYPDESMSLIQGCGSSNEPCQLSASIGDTLLITCQANNVYPEIYPTWINAMNIKQSSTNHTSGTFSTSVSIDILVDKLETELTCRFNHDNFSRSSNLRITAFIPENNNSDVTPVPDFTEEPNQISAVIIGVVVAIPIALIVIIAVVAILKWGSRRRTQRGQPEQIKNSEKYGNDKQEGSPLPQQQTISDDVVRDQVDSAEPLLTATKKEETFSKSQQHTMTDNGAKDQAKHVEPTLNAAQEGESSPETQQKTTTLNDAKDQPKPVEPTLQAIQEDEPSPKSSKNAEDQPEHVESTSHASREEKSSPQTPQKNITDKEAKVLSQRGRENMQAFRNTKQETIDDDDYKLRV